jgi:thioesterase domain-containing protein
MTAPNAEQLAAFLARELPLSTALGVEIAALDEAARALSLRAPLAPNRNPHGTAFGGSLATLALLAGWVLVYRALAADGIAAQLVVQHTECDYLVPARGALLASASLDEADWQRFIAALRDKGKARIEVEVSVESEGLKVVAFRARLAARGYDSASHS